MQFSQHKAWAKLNSNNKIVGWYSNHKNALENLQNGERVAFLPILEQKNYSHRVFKDEDGYEWLVIKLKSDKYYLAAQSQFPPIEYDMWKSKKVTEFLGEEFSNWKTLVSEGITFSHPYVPSPTKVIYPDEVKIA